MHSASDHFMKVGVRGQLATVTSRYLADQFLMYCLSNYLRSISVVLMSRLMLNLHRTASHTASDKDISLPYTGIEFGTPTGALDDSDFAADIDVNELNFPGRYLANNP